MTALGVGITFATIALLLTEFLRHRRTGLAAYGWAGLLGLIAAECLMFRGFQFISIYFTPIAWTCYILLADAAVLAIRGHSRLHDDPRQLAWIALLSIPLWLIFEAYNLRLQNWTYTGVPQAWPFALLGYGWSFATITPGIFETADLIESFGWFGPVPPFQFSKIAQKMAIVFGAICLLVPALVPQALAAHLFALVWVGFIFLLDPINFRLGLPSVIGDLAEGRVSRFYSLLTSGFVCGWLWEFWNYWAAAKWHYIFPILQHWKIFEMPIPGYLGFLPFALECFTMYVTATWILRGRTRETAHIRNTTMTTDSENAAD
ncbi:MAG: hypothetical protein JOZ80_15235 [Acidobacteriaceae bacterium]|nr:hypothetical protein [Acidobacteriaceae bacterium]